MVMDIPLATYIEENDFYGEPQIIKGIKFYPIKLLDRNAKNYFDNIFNYSRSQMFYLNEKIIIEENITQPWINVYSSQYQQFIDENSNDCLTYMKYFLSLVTDYSVNDIKIGYIDNQYCYDCKTCLDEPIIVQFEKKEENEKIKFVQFSGEEFDTVRKFIIKQNGRNYNYIDEWNYSFEEDLLVDIKEKKLKFSSLSDDIFTYKELSHLSNSDIKNMTLCQFAKGFEKAKQIKNYELNYPLMMSGKIKFDKSMLDYTTPIASGGRYDSILMQKEDIISKIEG